MTERRHGLARAAILAGVLAVLVVAWRGLFLCEELKPLYLQATVRTSVGDRAVLYFDRGRGFREDDASGAFFPGDGRFHVHRFALPRRPLFHLRLDPLTGPGTVEIRDVAIVNARGKVVVRIDPAQVRPLHPKEGPEPAGDAQTFRAPAGANDPQLRILLPSFPLLFRWRETYPYPALAGRLLAEGGAVFAAVLCLAFALTRMRRRTRGIAALVLLLFIGGRAWWLYGEGKATYLRVTLQSSVAGTAALYYDTGSGLSEKESSQVRIRGSADENAYRFLLPRATLRHLRFDPLTGPGTVVVSRLSLVDGFGRLLRDIDLSALRPGEQIAGFRPMADRVEMVMAESATDPQVDIQLPEPVPLAQERPFPGKAYAVRLLLEAAGCGLAVWLGMWAYRRRQAGKKDGGENAASPGRWPLWCLGCAAGLVLAMAATSGFDTHPDEKGHEMAARFYFANWLPPAADDPRLADSASVYGISYLFSMDVVYFFAAKTALLLRSVAASDYLGLRLFNVGLFAVLALLVARRSRSMPLPVFAVLATPQVWYLFSYFNSDALPLFLALIAAMQCVDPKARGFRFLHAPTVSGGIRGGIILGILVGLLFLSKIHYYLFLAFLMCYAGWQVIFSPPPAGRLVLFKKWLFVAFVAACVFVPRYAYDLAVNDFRKAEKAAQFMERHAGDAFKPSALAKSLETTYKGLRLREKGVTWQEMFLTNPEWRDLTASSLLGLYGYMDLYSEGTYYSAMMLVFALFLLAVLAFTVYGTPPRDAVPVAGALCAAAVTLGLSVYYSWNYDYQPQGRYLFPVIPMLLIGLSRLPETFRRRFVPVFTAACFTLGVWSFALTALARIPTGH